MSGNTYELDPQIRDFAASSERLFTPAYDALPYPEQRQIYSAWCRDWSGARPADIAVADLLISAAQADIPVRLYRPRQRTGRLPVILYLHGGGWILGDCDSHDQVTAGMAAATQCAVLSVDYRLAPEHRFPAAFDDSYAALSWLAEAADALNLDRDRLAVAGDSAGGALAAGIALASRDRGGPAIRFQALIYPGLRLQRPASAASVVGEASPGLSADAMSAYAAAYLATPSDACNPYAAPLNAERFDGLPPAFVAAAWHDVLREDSEIYVQRLQQAGIPVRYRCAAGLPHTYLRTIHFCDAARTEFLAVCDALKEALT
jgi:acetyl esterase